MDRSEAFQGAVVILSAEDDPEDTIRPRLEAAGADLEHIYILHAIQVPENGSEATRRGFNLAVDSVRLAALMNEIKAKDMPVSLVIIDPISAYLGDADSHNNAEVRAILAPLQTVAAQQSAAILGVSHLTKAQGVDALLRLQGSVAFGAAARAVWGVTKDKDNPQRRLMLPLKNNLGTDISGFAYTLQSFVLEGSDPPIGTSHVMWESDKVTQSADEAFSSPARDHSEQSALDDAKEFLRSYLAGGMRKVSDVDKEARSAGHSHTTLRRAKAELRIKACQDDFHGPWYWKLP